MQGHGRGRMNAFGWPPSNAFYVRGALAWLAIALLAVAMTMAIVSLNQLISSISTARLRYAARLAVAIMMASGALTAILRLVGTNQR